MRLPTLTIVGVGLIGGSIGLATKKRGVVDRVVGVGRDAAKLELARQLGAIDVFAVDLGEGVRDAGLVVFCTPVDCIVEQMIEAAPNARQGAMFTDAGSTKRQVVEVAQARLPPAVRFVGGHPLAGSEKKGVENAHADLFVDRCTVLTPTCGTSDTALDTVANFWLALGARVKTMSPEEHDQALAMTSHLPHLVAAALAGILPADLHELAATGFRDATRIAAGDPAVWTPIFQHNHAAVLAALDQLEVRLRRFRAALESNDVIAIDSLLTQGKRMRDALGS